MAGTPVSALEPVLLFMWPALEVHFEHGVCSQRRKFWVEKWIIAGGKIFDGRLIALKNDPVWRAMTGATILKGEASRKRVFLGVHIHRREAVAYGLIQPKQRLRREAFADASQMHLTREYSRVLDDLC